MDYNSSIKRLSLVAKFIQDITIQKVPTKKQFLEWLKTQAYLIDVPIMIKNVENEPVSTSIIQKFYSPDNVFAGQIQTIDFKSYGFTVEELGYYRGRSGSIEGLMHRMSTAFGDGKKTAISAFPPVALRVAKTMLKFRNDEQVYYDFEVLCKAAQFEDFSKLCKADLSTSSGPRFFKKNSPNDQYAATSMSKREVLNQYGEVAVESIAAIMNACASDNMVEELRALYENNPSWFTLALRGKEEVVDLRAQVKCRPYWSCDIALVLLGSAVFGILDRLILPFWEDPTSVSALGLNWFFDSARGLNGAEKVLEFIEETPDGQTRSMGYGDDCLFVRNEGGRMLLCAPDVSHLDMSAMAPHFAFAKDVIHSIFLKVYPDYNKTWVRGFVDFYLNLAEKNFLLVMPHGYVYKKKYGVPSGIPGTTILDLLIMLPFHAAMKTAIFTEAGICKAGLSCGFIIKPETTEVVQYDFVRREVQLPFLGNRIVQYNYSTVGIKLIPVNQLFNYMKSALYPRDAPPKTPGETAAWHMLRLYGLSVSGGLFYPEFSTSAFKAFSSHKQALLRSEFKDSIVDDNIVLSFTVSGPETSYLEQLRGKKFSDIEIPRTGDLLAMYYPDVLTQIPKSIGVLSDTHVDISREKSGLFLDLEDSRPGREEIVEEKEEPLPQDVKKVSLSVPSDLGSAPGFSGIAVPEDYSPVVVRQGPPENFKIDNLQRTFLEKNFPDKYQAYLALLDVRAKITDVLSSDPQGDDLFAPLMNSIDEFLVKFLEGLMAQYLKNQKDALERERQRTRDQLVEKIQAIMASMSWADTPPDVPLRSKPQVSLPIDALDVVRMQPKRGRIKPDFLLPTPLSVPPVLVAPVKTGVSVPSVKTVERRERRRLAKGKGEDVGVPLPPMSGSSFTPQMQFYSDEDEDTPEFVVQPLNKKGMSKTELALQPTKPQFNRPRPNLTQYLNSLPQHDWEALIEKVLKNKPLGPKEKQRLSTVIASKRSLSSEKFDNELSMFYIGVVSARVGDEYKRYGVDLYKRYV